MKRNVVLAAVLTMTAACGPYQPVALKSVRHVRVESITRGQAKLTADANLYNPNRLRARLKKIKVEVLVDDKPSASVDQRLKAVIRPHSDFTVPIEANISLKEFGLIDTIMDFISGRRYRVEYHGYLRIKVGGVPVKVPIEFKDEVRLRP